LNALDISYVVSFTYYLDVASLKYSSKSIPFEIITLNNSNLLNYLNQARQVFDK